MKQRVVIVGAGISGLALGWFLKRFYGNSIDLTILEKDNRPGGWVRTIVSRGFLFDTGPRSCRTRGAGKNTLKLIEDLGLQNEVVACSPDACHRYLYTNNKLQKLPSSLIGACFSPLTRRYIPLLWKEWFTPSCTMSDETISAFLSRRLNTSFAENLFDPLTLGIYAGDIGKLSMGACFPDMVRWEQQYGGIIKGLLRSKPTDDIESSAFVKNMCRSPIITFKKGMETLTRTLADNLSMHIKLECAVTNISITSSKICVETAAEKFHCDHVFLAIPPHAIAKAIVDLNPHVEGFQAASVASVHMGWNKKILPKEGFGYLIPSREKEPLLGVIFDSSAFPQQNGHANQTRITAMMGGVTGPDTLAMNDGVLKSVGIQSIYKHTGIDTPPDTIEVSRAPQSIPQYNLGHAERVKKLKEEIDTIFDQKVTLLGSSWHGVSVNDCIREAEELAMNLTCD